MSKFDKVDKAYKKALKVVESCKTQEHIRVTLRYLHLFDELVERLFEIDGSSSQKDRDDRAAVRNLPFVLDYKLTAKSLNIKEQI